MAAASRTSEDVLPADILNCYGEMALFGWINNELTRIKFPAGT